MKMLTFVINHPFPCHTIINCCYTLPASISGVLSLLSTSIIHCFLSTSEVPLPCHKTILVLLSYTFSASIPSHLTLSLYSPSSLQDEIDHVEVEMIEAEPAEDDDNDEEESQLTEYTDLLAVSAPFT